MRASARKLHAGNDMRPACCGWVAGTQVPVFATVVEKMWQRQLRGAILNIMKSYASRFT